MKMNEATGENAVREIQFEWDEWNIDHING